VERRDCNLPDRRGEVIGENMASPIKSLRLTDQATFVNVLEKTHFVFFFLFRKKCSDIYEIKIKIILRNLCFILVVNVLFVLFVFFF